MIWLLKLYPPRWRRRYGAEIAELIAVQPFSMGAAFDLLAGAIDAWLHPELTTALTPDSTGSGTRQGDETMIAKLMQLKCAGYGPEITASDKAKNAAVNIGGTFVLALVWLWATWQFGKNFYVAAIGPMAYLLPYLLGLRYTSLKGRSARTQAILIICFAAVLAAFFLLVASVGTKI